MKKVVVLLSSLTLLIFFVSIFMLSVYANEKEKSVKLEGKIDEITENIKSTSDGNSKIELELESLKESNKEKVLELEVWQKTKEKLEKGL